MRITLAMALVASAIATSAAAQAPATRNGWAGTGWGSSPHEVQRAFPTARSIPATQQAGRCNEGDGRALLEIPRHQDFGRVWQATLCFAGAGNGMLQAVHLWREDDRDFRAAGRDMIARYGKPLEYVPGRVVPGERISWTIGDTAIVFAHMHTHSGALTYKATQPR